MEIVSNSERVSKAFMNEKYSSLCDKIDHYIYNGENLDIFAGIDYYDLPLLATAVNDKKIENIDNLMSLSKINSFALENSDRERVQMVESWRVLNDGDEYMNLSGQTNISKGDNIIATLVTKGNKKTRRDVFSFSDAETFKHYLEGSFEKYHSNIRQNTASKFAESSDDLNKRKYEEMGRLAKVTKSHNLTSEKVDYTQEDKEKSEMVIKPEFREAIRNYEILYLLKEVSEMELHDPKNKEGAFYKGNTVKSFLDGLIPQSKSKSKFTSDLIEKYTMLKRTDENEILEPTDLYYTKDSGNSEYRPEKEIDKLLKDLHSNAEMVYRGSTEYMYIDSLDETLTLDDKLRMEKDELKEKGFLNGNGTINYDKVPKIDSNELKQQQKEEADSKMTRRQKIMRSMRSQ